MRELLSIALLAFAFVVPDALLAQENARFPTISPDKFSAKHHSGAGGLSAGCKWRSDL